MKEMKSSKLMAVVLSITACITTTLFAEDDFGIESAMPTAIADPVNPQPGMVLSGYKSPSLRTTFSVENWLKDSIASLPKAPAIKTTVDKSEDFSLKAIGATECNAGMWSGFMKCKRAGVYTLAFAGANAYSGYSLRVNGRPAIGAGKGQTSADVSLKVGWNKIEIVSLFGGSRRSSNFPRLNVTYKPKESLSDARPLTPAMMFHDEKPEEDW